jgi:ankyrin repeat protein
LHYANIIVNPRDAVPLIDYLVRQGADVNAQNNLKETPLMWASQASLAENLQAIFKEMISNLADVNMQNNIGSTYLHLLIRNKDILGVQYMMEHFGSMFDLHQKDREGLTPLEYAKNTLQPESTRAIESFRPLGTGDNVKVRDELGRSPLMLAVIRNDLPFAERQIKFDAKVDATDTTKYKNMPIHFAVARQYTVAPFVTLLLNNKADPNAKNAFGETPLHYLVKYNIRSPERNALAKLLIEKGANPNIANKKGETALDLARKVDGGFAEKLESLFRQKKK